MAHGGDILKTIIALTDMIGSVAKGIQKLTGIWKRKAARIPKVKQETETPSTENTISL